VTPATAVTALKHSRTVSSAFEMKQHMPINNKRVINSVV